MIVFRESTPIYLQIMQKIKADIVSGRLKGGDKMMSVREYSESLKVNPNTIQRVFLELEREGITYSQRGVGTFIVEGKEILEKLKDTLAQKYARRFAAEMKELGMRKEEIVEYLNKAWED
ncbi:transcriptional regulator, GntR family [Syntrophobotulus glycolicus DSM 8271]|uniref:Transcriptional regulator, GntR family n=1 Tax=Syntrophobotulus glycolicus (strain DSM 8271 / FlGlyR) TaxID=645991 RepID=F0SZM0_SYNGF|nr:GntR family transcriptional regulator [Syntrophobotulus glycolicus]ADY56106.1 transcriptional regulator, GntR family [Syntrophobotulus glycolicus DSM 8271]